MKESSIIIIVTSTVPLISTIVAFFLGKWQDRYKYKIEAMKERYLKLYCPFIKIYIFYVKINELPNANNLEFQLKILELINDNIVYLDTYSLIHFQLFYNIIKIKGHSDKEPFFELIDTMLKECKYLEKKLKYPMKAQVLLMRQNILK